MGPAGTEHGNEAENVEKTENLFGAAETPTERVTDSLGKSDKDIVTQSKEAKVVDGPKEDTNLDKNVKTGDGMNPEMAIIFMLFAVTGISAVELLRRYRKKK